MLSGKQCFAYALFENESSAKAGVEGLLGAEFASERIGALMLDNSGVTEVSMKHKTGIGPGAVLGTLLGAAMGVALPGLGLIALGGAFTTASAALAGGATGTLAGVVGGMGLWKDEFDFPREAFQRGGVLVGTLTAPERAPIARDALAAAGGRAVTVATADDARRDLSERANHARTP